MSMYSDNQNSGAANWLVGAVKNNPEGLLLLADGCALLMGRSGTSKSHRSRADRGYGRNDMTQSGREARRPNGRRKLSRLPKRRRLRLRHRLERC
jgi:hypothetical protein